MMTGFPGIVRHHFRILDPASWLSLVIRICTWSKWNHCFILLQEDGILYVVEARGKGVVKVTFDEWRRHRRHKTWRIGMPYHTVPEDMAVRIASKIGRKYDHEALFLWHPIRIFLEWLESSWYPIRLIKAKWFGGVSPKGRLTCSELVGLCWIEDFPSTWYHLTTEDIVRSGKFNFDDISLTLYFK